MKGFNVIGFDTNKNRVNELKDHNDCNDDISIENLETLNKNGIESHRKARRNATRICLCLS